MPIRRVRRSARKIPLGKAAKLRKAGMVSKLGFKRDKLRSAYAVIAERQQRLEDDERNTRAARRQLELFMDDGIRERITVALALLDENVESRSEAWFDFTEQRGQ